MDESIPPPPRRSARPALIMVALWMLLVAGVLAWNSFCLFCGPGPDVGLLAGGALAVGAAVFFIVALPRDARPAARMLAAGAMVASSAIVVVGIAADVIASQSDPFGIMLGSHFHDHGTWLAAVALLGIGLPMSIAYAATNIELGRPNQSLRLVGLGIAAGLALVAVPGVVPPVTTSDRWVESERLGYEAMLPPEFAPGGAWGVFLGQRWQLPAEIDWFNRDPDPSSGGSQLSVWSTPLDADTTLDSFVEDQIDADREMGMIGPLSRADATLAGGDAVRLTYRAVAAPTVSGNSYWMFGSGQIENVWADCRFYLENLIGEVRVDRVVGVVGDRGFVVSGYTLPGRDELADGQLSTFSASLNPSVLEAGQASASKQRPYPIAKPMTSPEDNC